MATFPHWQEKLCYAIAGKVNRQAVRLLTAWQRAEGGSADFNPLNTTMSVPGATLYNKAGVRNYPDELAGLAATLLTLRLAYYRKVVASLRSMLLASSPGIHTWGTSVATVAAALKSTK
jgi:hypothetical protein